MITQGLKEEQMLSVWLTFKKKILYDWQFEKIFAELDVFITCKCILELQVVCVFTQDKWLKEMAAKMWFQKTLILQIPSFVKEVVQKI